MQIPLTFNSVVVSLFLLKTTLTISAYFGAGTTTSRTLVFVSIPMSLNHFSTADSFSFFSLVMLIPTKQPSLSLNIKSTAEYFSFKDLYKTPGCGFPSMHFRNWSNVRGAHGVLSFLLDRFISQFFSLSDSSGKLRSIRVDSCLGSSVILRQSRF